MAKEKQQTVIDDPTIQASLNFFSSKNNSSLKPEIKAEDTSSISSGSIILDDMIGFIKPCVFRLYGASGGGKTSCALSYMKSFLTTVDNSKAVYFKAEGRLSSTVRDTSGIKFVSTLTDWTTGTCLVVDGNIYEDVFGYIKSLVTLPDNPFKFFFLIDSIDGLVTQGDSVKDFSEATKVAGGAALCTQALKLYASAVIRQGSYLFIISQQRTKVSVGYVHEVKQMSLDCSGGHALTHYSDVILEFNPIKEKSQFFPSNGSALFPDRAASIRDFFLSRSDLPYGHMAEGTVKKSDANVQNLKFQYPVRYDRNSGEAIWWEREVMYMLLAQEFITLDRGFVTPSDDFNKILKNHGIEEVGRIRGGVIAEKQFFEKGILSLFRELFNKQTAERNLLDESGKHIGYSFVNELM